MATAVELERLRRDNERLRRFINGVLLGSLLDIRRAAFGPPIGCRYSEAIRADIGGACRTLEQACHKALDES